MNVGTKAVMNIGMNVGNERWEDKSDERWNERCG